MFALCSIFCNFPFLNIAYDVGCNQLVGMIVEERGELEVENRALHSLVLLTRMEVCKADWEME